MFGRLYVIIMFGLSCFTFLVSLNKLGKGTVKITNSLKLKPGKLIKLKKKLSCKNE